MEITVYHVNSLLPTDLLPCLLLWKGHTVIKLCCFSPLAAMLTSLQQIPQATSPLTSRVIPGASSPGPLDIYTQDPLSYVQATSPQPAGFGGLTLNRVSTLVKAQGGTLIFSYICRLGSFFGVQNFEFQYFLGFSEK